MIKEIGWTWLKSKTVELNLELDKSGAVPGEVVIITAIFQNHSKQKMSTSTLSFIQVTFTFLKIICLSKYHKYDPSNLHYWMGRSKPQ